MTSNDRAELDSALNTLEDVIGRVSGAAERHAGEAAGEGESVAVDLFEVERSLRAASRRLAVVVRRLDAAG